MIPFAERLKTLSTTELERLESILLLLARNPNRELDELLAQIGAPQTALNQSDTNLVGARCYELEICAHLDTASAHKQAMAEFEAGKLHPQPKKSIPGRARRRTETNSAGPAAVAGQANA